MINKGDKIRAVCGCCMNIEDEKKVLDMKFIPDGGTQDAIIVIIHKCPVCNKLSQAAFKSYSWGPLDDANGFSVKI